MRNTTSNKSFGSETILKKVFRNKVSIMIQIIVFVITAFSIASLVNLKVNPKWSNALPQTDPIVSEYLKIVEDSLRGSVVYAVIDGSEKEHLADELYYTVSKLPGVRFVFDGRINLANSHLSLHSLDKHNLQQRSEIINNLNIDQLVNLFEDKLKSYISFSNITSQKPLLIYYWNQFLNTMQLAFNKQELPPMDDLIDNMFFTHGDRIYSTDRKSLLVLIGTNISGGTIDNIEVIADTLNSISHELLKKYSQSDLKLTGYPITARDEMQSITESGKRITLWALFIVAVFLLIINKQVKFVAASILVLCIAVVWTLNINQILFEELNTVTLIMGLILIGLGIDFSIHWINYKISDKKPGSSNSQVEKHYWKRTAVPILTGAFTTAASFLALLILNVKSINEFGLMSFIGISITAILILLLMPMFIKDFKFPSTYEKIRTKIYLFVCGVINQKKKIILLSAALLAGCIWVLPGLKYEYNYAKLQIGDLPSYETKNEIAKKFGFASDVFLNRAIGIKTNEELKQRLETSPNIGYVMSVSDFIPTTEKFNNNDPLVNKLLTETNSIECSVLDKNNLNELKNNLKDIRSLLKHVDADSATISKTLTSITNLAGFLTVENLYSINRFNEYWINSFKDRINLLQADDRSSVKDIPKKIKYLFSTSQPDEFVQYIYAVNDTWEKENIESLEPVLSSIAPNAVGLSRISYKISNWIVQKIIFISIASFLIIFLTLLFMQKSFKYATIALITPIVGIILTLATLSLLNIKVSLYNLIALPLILGVGIDNSIHVVHSYKQSINDGPENAYLKVGPALFLTALTSMIGFGFLFLYTHPGISSLGIATFFGIGWCFTVTILFLPIVINYLHKHLLRGK